MAGAFQANAFQVNAFQSDSQPVEPTIIQDMRGLGGHTNGPSRNARKIPWGKDSSSLELTDSELQRSTVVALSGLGMRLNLGRMGVSIIKRPVVIDYRTTPEYKRIRQQKDAKALMFILMNID